MKKNAKLVLSWLLRALSVYLVYDGAVVFWSTNGYVQGSEFGMLITLANQLSLVMVWLALYALWTLAPDPNPAAGSEA